MNRVEQIVDKTVHLLPRSHRNVEDLFPSSRLQILFLQQLCRRHDQAQRIAQIVRDDAQRLFAGAGLELGVFSLLALGVVALRPIERRRGSLRQQ